MSVPGAYYLTVAAVQVIVYAGAIVVLFLFVIMLLGVDRAEDLESDPLKGQRPAALVAGVLIGGGLIAMLVTSTITGRHSTGAKADPAQPNVNQIGRLLFTQHLWAFEITSVLLVIAVVGAVVLARRGTSGPGAEPVDAALGDEGDVDVDVEEKAT